MKKPPSLNGVYQRLFTAYGPQGWWPGETDFEICVGAILTQNVAWGNVEKAIANLKIARLLSPAQLHRTDVETIAPLIRPSGYFNQKAKKLKNFMEWFSRFDFSFERLRAMEIIPLRDELLGINGIGEETADSILLYAIGKRIFVVDAYTRRIFQRLGILDGSETYAAVQRIFHRRFAESLQDYNEYHALIVRHGKYHCRKKPSCAGCCLTTLCAAAVLTLPR